MAFKGFSSKTVDFLNDLKANNSKAWFDENRKRYDDHVLGPSRDFVEAVGLRMKASVPEFVAIPKVNKSLFRINRDTRFSKNKDPYKTNLGVTFWVGSGKRMERAGWYWHLDPDGEMFMGGGLYMFGKEQLQRWRDAIDGDEGEACESLLKLARDGGMKVYGEGGYKRVPRGYDKDHPRADLLKHKGVFISRSAGLETAFSVKLLDSVCAVFEETTPFVRWLAEHVA